MVEIAFKILDAILPAFFNRRRLRVRVHRAFFLEHESAYYVTGVILAPRPQGVECFFVNLTNRSSARDLEVTHVWFQANRQIQILHPERPLPVRLKPDQS